MAEVIKGDTTKGIKSVGELALRISRFDSYRLFTLYENAREGKLMDVSGDQKHYLVFRSPKKEIRIPEYDPKGFFEVDKVNGCVLFKITKKNAEDILSMKTAGEKIFHIVRVYEEKDAFGRITNVTDEVEVYHGKWGDDDAFTTFTTENKVDLLTKALAAQVDKNAKLLNEYNDLMEKYNLEVQKTSDLEKEIEELRAQIASLEQQLVDYTGDTYNGTILSTDTKYIALHSSLESLGTNITEEQYKSAIDELMTSGSVDMNDILYDEHEIDLKVDIPRTGTEDRYKDLKINIKKNGNNLGEASYGKGNEKDTTVTIKESDIFIFRVESKKDENGNDLFTNPNKAFKYSVFFSPAEGFKGRFILNDDYNKDISTKKSGVEQKIPSTFTVTAHFADENGNPLNEQELSKIDNIGKLYFSII